ncbi:MAG: hypothetical protein KDA38_17490, partial [Planctomycetales bacterium]|nr:hypothetical protein [Planctomycetales bacterium]
MRRFAISRQSLRSLPGFVSRTDRQLSWWGCGSPADAADAYGPVTLASQDRDAVFPHGRPPEPTLLMSATQPQISLLDELDARQNDVLRQIDEL